MKVEVHRTIKNIFRAKKEGNKIVVVANWLLSLNEIKNILHSNAWTQKVVEEKQIIRNNESPETVKQDNCRYMYVGDKYNDNKSKHEQFSFRQSYEECCKSEMFNGKKVLICGEIYDVCPSLIAKTHLDDNKVFIHESLYNEKSERVKQIKMFLRRMARIYLSSEVSDFGTLAGLCPEKIDFKELKCEWTKCCDSVKRLVNIDFRTIQLPVMLRRYIIVHTFCHFNYPDHDGRFWNAISNYMPNYMDYRQELRNYEYLLQI